MTQVCQVLHQIACNAFLPGLVLSACLLLLVSFPGTTTGCCGIAVASELNLIHECPVLQPLRRLRQQYTA